jgi:hypothetical protein
MSALQYVVSCDHRDASYRLDNETVTVKADAYGEGYYWNHAKYGCSNSYETPTDAIMGILVDHACFDIRIKGASE